MHVVQKHSMAGVLRVERPVVTVKKIEHRSLYETASILCCCFSETKRNPEVHF